MGDVNGLGRTMKAAAFGERRKGLQVSQVDINAHDQP